MSRSPLFIRTLFNSVFNHGCNRCIVSQKVSSTRHIVSLSLAPSWSTARASWRIAPVLMYCRRVGHDPQNYRRLLPFLHRFVEVSVDKLMFSSLTLFAIHEKCNSVIASWSCAKLLPPRPANENSNRSEEYHSKWQSCNQRRRGRVWHFLCLPRAVQNWHRSGHWDISCSFRMKINKKQ